jgi:DNA-binding MarR family transcriptional regulator
MKTNRSKAGRSAGAGQAPSSADGVKTVADELRQSRPFRSPAQEAMLAVVLTADRVLARVGEALATEADITYQQYNVLRILRGAGDEGLPTLAVRDRLIEEAPGITRLIDKLEEAGHVRRDRTGKDRRTVRCRITSKGLALLETMDSPVRTANELVAAGLPSEEEQRVLIDLLARLRAPLL